MMDTMKKYLTLLLLAVVSVATGAGCSSNDKPVQITSLKLNEKDLELTVGESFRLVATTRPADAGATIRWTSSDESVATVDQAGLVTLRAFGTAVITARYRSYSARCTVATLQEPPLDPSAALGAPLSDDIVYSKNVVLYAPRRIMQGFDLTDYCGKRVKRYTYEITNYPTGERGIQAGLLVYKSTVIGGDVLSAQLGGFIHGLEMPA